MLASNLIRWKNLDVQGIWKQYRGRICSLEGSSPDRNSSEAVREDVVGDRRTTGDAHVHGPAPRRAGKISDTLVMMVLGVNVVNMVNAEG